MLMHLKFIDVICLILGNYITFVNDFINVLISDTWKQKFRLFLILLRDFSSSSVRWCWVSSYFQRDAGGSWARWSSVLAFWVFSNGNKSDFPSHQDWCSCYLHICAGTYWKGGEILPFSLWEMLGSIVSDFA